jgi:hypothetical protein
VKSPQRCGESRKESVEIAPAACCPGGNATLTVLHVEQPKCGPAAWTLDVSGDQVAGGGFCVQVRVRQAAVASMPKRSSPGMHAFSIVS